jgi:phosphonatase-like hydrolase
MIKMVVFDMAGTTVNENNVVYKTLQKAIQEAGFPVTLDQVLAEGAGKEKLEAIKSILKVFAGKQDEGLSKNIYKNFIAQLETAYRDLDIYPQEGALEVFSQLKAKGIRVVLNTGYNKETAWSLTNKLGWKKGVEFDSLVTASEVPNSRPDPDMIWLAMEQVGLHERSEVAKVGDSVIDIEEGRNAGCGLVVGITTGAHSRAQLSTSNPDRIIDHLSELLPLLG